MKPMFSYMGSKFRLSKHYGKPEYPIVIEPFAGSAAYSLYWDVQKAILFDVSPEIVCLWKYLISAAKEEILSLPTEFEDTSTLDIPEGAKHLIGFWCGKGRTTPAKKRSAWGREYKDHGKCHVWSESCKKRIASQVDKIRSWEIYQSDFSTSPNIEATWLIDPPYQGKGYCYKHNKIDFKALAEFCLSRKGQVYVCENTGANWLPFEHFLTVKATNGKGRNGMSRESLWTNGIKKMRQIEFLEPSFY